MYSTLNFIRSCLCRPQEINCNELICPVSLDPHHIGKDAIIIKGGQRLCGSGGALCNVPILQDKAYFEVKIQQTGIWGFGLGTRMTNFQDVPMGNDKYSWVFRNDGNICHNNQILFTNHEKPKECDTLGASFDHVEMCFYANGKFIEGSNIQRIKGTLYPIFYVDDGAILDVHFYNFVFPPPNGFRKIMVEHSLI